jgi:hypothetical protein
MAPTARAGGSFIVARSELLDSIKTIGVMPIEIDRVVPNDAEVAASLERQIVEHLESGGFAVVLPGEMRAIRDRGQKLLGGIYDPMTGIAIKERQEALREFARTEYRTLHPVDAVLQCEVEIRPAEMNFGKAEWDGVAERVSNEGAVATWLTYAMGSASKVRQVRALSLAVRLVDAKGNNLYAGRGGLLLLQYTTLSENPEEYDFTSADPRFSLTDPVTISRALAVGLDPLANGIIPAQTQSFSVPPPRQSHKSDLTSLLKKFRRIALAPLETVPPLEPSDEMRARYTKMLDAKLTTLGFVVLRGIDMEALWSAERAAAGGFYDVSSGRPDAAKLRSARARIFAALHTEHNISAIVRPSVVLRSAHYFQGFATWDGVSETVTGHGSWLFNASIFNSNLPYSGDLRAFSLNLKIIDAADEVQFEGVGGMELAQHLDHGRAVPGSDAAPFTDPGSYAKAIAAALHPLGTQRHP